MSILIASSVDSDMNTCDDATVSDLFCDKISMTLSIEPSQEGIVIENFENLQSAGHAKWVHKSIYRLSLQVVDEMLNPIVLVQCRPVGSGRSFFRTEFNPSKVSMWEVMYFIDSILPDGYESLHQHGICTRFDATVDIHNVNINELLIWKPQISVTSAYYKSGRTETYYLGAKSSPKQCCVYDKVAEIKRRNEGPFVKQEIPDHEITRIEVRLKNRTPVKGLHCVDDLFSQLGIVEFSDIDPMDEKFDLFLRASRAEGAQNVLLSLSEATRKSYRKILNNSKALWWEPEKIWAQWPELVSRITHPPASKPYYGLLACN